MYTSGSVWTEQDVDIPRCTDYNFKSPDHGFGMETYPRVMKIFSEAPVGVCDGCQGYLEQLRPIGHDPLMPESAHLRHAEVGRRRYFECST